MNARIEYEVRHVGNWWRIVFSVSDDFTVTEAMLDDLFATEHHARCALEEIL